MHSTLKLSLAALALVGGTVLATAAALRPQYVPASGVAQDEPAAGPGQERPAARVMPTMDPAELEKVMKLAALGEPHKELAKMAGQWEREYKMRWSPDAWMDAKGTSEAKTLLGGRYVMETIKFQWMGMQMEGVLLLGYDNMKQEYISLWADSMSTWWVTSRGKKGPDGKIDMKGTMVDIFGERPFRMAIHPKSDDLVESVMYETIPPAGEIEWTKVVARRKK